MSDHDHRTFWTAQRVDTASDDSKRIDVEAGVCLVENGEAWFHDGHLENLVALLFATAEASVDRAVEEIFLHLDEIHCLLGHVEEITCSDFGLAARSPH